MRFPQHQRLRIGAGITIFKPEHAIFAQRTVEHLEPAVSYGAQRHIFFFRLLVDPDRVPLGKGPTPAVLPGQSDIITFRYQRSVSQSLAGRPVEILAALEHLRLCLEHPSQRLVNRQALGNRGQRPAETVEQFRVDRGFDIAPRGLRIGRNMQALPAPAKPVGLVGLVVRRRLEFGLEMVGKGLSRRIGPLRVDDAFLDQPRLVQLADLGMLLDRGIHQGLGKARFVALVVPEAAIAPHVDHDIPAEALAELDRDLAGKGHRFRIIAVDVENRCLHALGHVRRIRRRARELRAGGEADLVVDHEMDAAAGIVAADAGEAEAFPDNALAGKGGIAVDQHRQHLVVLFEIVAGHLLGANLAEHHRVDRFQMRRVWHQAHMDIDAVKFAVG